MTRHLIASLLVITLLVAAAVFVMAPKASAQNAVPALGSTRAERNWEFINANSWGHNFNPQTQLTTENVHLAEMKWVFPIPDADSIGCTNLNGFCGTGGIAPPLIIDGYAYLVTNYQTIFKIDMETGAQVWYSERTADGERTDIIGEQVQFHRGLNPPGLPVFSLSAHTHSMNAWELNGEMILWLNSFGCTIKGISAETGEEVFTLLEHCRNVPTNSGLYNAQGSHAPVVDRSNNQIIVAVGGHMEGSYGGRSYVAAYDLGACSSFPCTIDATTDTHLNWRFFYQPPNGELFPDEYKAWGEWLVDTCDVGFIEGVSSCDVPAEVLRWDWSGMPGTYNEKTGMPFNAGVSNIWGQMVVDEENGRVYFGTAQPGPDFNTTFTKGPRLFGSAIVGLNSGDGSLAWYFQSSTKDVWDMDCSWSTTMMEIDGVRTVIKQCKQGHVHAFDAASGDPIWITEIPGVHFSKYYCNAACDNGGGPNNGLRGRGVLHSVPLGIDGLGDNAKNWAFFDMRVPADVLKPWQSHPAPQSESFWQNPNGSGCAENDIAFDGDFVFVACKNEPVYIRAMNVDFRCHTFTGCFMDNRNDDAPFPREFNHTVTAIDARTGEVKWDFFVDTVAHRGGIIASGGVVYWNGFDGKLRAVAADTGELLHQFNFGTALDTQPTIGQTADGKTRLMQSYGGRGLTSQVPSLRGSVPGALTAFGLPDQLPEGVSREVEVREVIKEVEVPVEVISPISYVAIGLGVVLVVISGVLFTRSRQTT